MFKILLSVLLLGSSSAFILGDLFGKQEKWDGLKVTWGANPLDSNNFKPMPRTTKDATAQGFVKISDCDDKASWRGARYTKDGDNSLILLFGKNGYIAGIQTMVPPGQKYGYPTTKLQPPFVKDDNGNFLLTAYFVNPTTICSTGRSADDFNSQGTGTNLYIQNGSNPETNSVMIPHQETGMPATKWTKGKCFVTMGLHYWHDISDDMDCDEFFPVFILYNKGELTAFGWALGIDLPSKHLEHPGTSTYSLFMESVPKCLMTRGTLSTMHIYLTSTVYKDTC